jgi:hypothetical protein
MFVVTKKKKKDANVFTLQHEFLRFKICFRLYLRNRIFKLKKYYFSKIFIFKFLLKMNFDYF